MAWRSGLHEIFAPEVLKILYKNEMARNVERPLPNALLKIKPKKKKTPLALPRIKRSTPRAVSTIAKLRLKLLRDIEAMSDSEFLVFYQNFSNRRLHT